MARAKRQPRGIQGELDIPGDPNKPKIPAKLKKLLPSLCEAIYNAATYKGQENEYKASCRDIMAEAGLSTVPLPNGGTLLYQPGKPSVKYVAPKNTSTNGDGEAEDGEGGYSDDE